MPHRLAPNHFASRLIDAARAEAEERRVRIWSETPSRVLVGLALQELAGNIEQIQHLNVTPSFLGQAFEQMLIGEGE